jgi:SSS family solute:Na+ symporter
MTLAIIFAYLALVLLIGGWSHRFFRGTGEDYFVASRSLGPFLLLMSLFGTNMTAFAILGASGEAYHRGIGVFALMASSSAIVIPVVFFFVGTRLWALGKRHGYLTQVQYFRQRWDSDGLGLLLFIVLVALVVPYLLIGIMGGGLTLSQITHGQIPAWAGSLLVCSVVMTYVCFGGMRGTAWANALQTLVFMSLGAVAFGVIVDKLGGLSQALEHIAAHQPHLLIRGEQINAVTLLSYTCIPLSAGMFPHLFMHWLTAKSMRTFRLPIILYPLCIAAMWIPSVLLGLFGHIDFPGLQGPAANGVLVQLIERHATQALAGLLAAGVFAAIMSSLDSQVLAVGTMFTQDIVRHYGLRGELDEKRQIYWGRLFVGVVMALAYLLSLVVNRSIFSLAVWCFTGYAALFPLVLAALFWKRSTKHGAFACIASVTLLWVFFFVQGWRVPGYSVGATGLLPVTVMLALGALALVLVSLMTRPPDTTVLRRFFPDHQAS